MVTPGRERKVISAIARFDGSPRGFQLVGWFGTFSSLRDGTQRLHQYQDLLILGEVPV